MKNIYIGRFVVANPCSPGNPCLALRATLLPVTLCCSRLRNLPDRYALPRGACGHSPSASAQRRLNGGGYRSPAGAHELTRANLGPPGTKSESPRKERSVGTTESRAPRTARRDLTAGQAKAMQCSGADSCYTNASHRLNAETSGKSIPGWIACLFTVAENLSVSIAGQAPSRSPDRTVRQASPRLQHGSCRRTINKSIDRASAAPKPRLLQTLSPTSLQVVSEADPKSGTAIAGSGMAWAMRNAVVQRSSLSPCRCFRFEKLPQVVWNHLDPYLVTIHSALLSVAEGPVAT